MSNQQGSTSSNDARAASFNPQHAAFNPNTVGAGSAFEGRSQGSMDARSASFNPQSSAYNPNTASGSGHGSAGHHGGGGKK